MEQSTWFILHIFNLNIGILPATIWAKMNAEFFCFFFKGLSHNCGYSCAWHWLINLKKKNYSVCCLSRISSFIFCSVYVYIWSVFFDIFSPWSSVIKETRISKLARRFSQRKEKMNIRWGSMSIWYLSHGFYYCCTIMSKCDIVVCAFLCHWHTERKKDHTV